MASVDRGVRWLSTMVPDRPKEGWSGSVMLTRPEGKRMGLRRVAVRMVGRGGWAGSRSTDVRLTNEERDGPVGVLPM